MRAPKTTTPPIAVPTASAMKSVDRAIVTKALRKVQIVLWTTFQIATRSKDLDLTKSLRDQHKALGDKIVEINGGPGVVPRARAAKPSVRDVLIAWIVTSLILALGVVMLLIAQRGCQ